MPNSSILCLKNSAVVVSRYNLESVQRLRFVVCWTTEKQDFIAASARTGCEADPASYQTGAGSIAVEA